MSEFEPTGWAAIVIAVVTAAVTLWTQRGGARARRRTAAVEERAQSLAEFKEFMSYSKGELGEQREQISTLRAEIRSAQHQLVMRDRSLDAAIDHIQLLRLRIPTPPGAPELPEILREYI